MSGLHTSSVEADKRSDHGGIVLILLAVAMFVSMDTIVKYLAAIGYPVLQIVWARFIFHLLFALPILLIFYPGRFRTRRLRLQMIRSLLLFVTTFTFFYALKLISLAAATTIMFAAPLFLIGLSVVILGEKVGLRRWLGVAAGFTGIVLIIRPGPTMDLAYLVPLAAAFIYANYQLMTRMMSGDEHAVTTFFYTPMAGAIVTSAIVIFHAPLSSLLDYGLWRTPENAEVWILMAGCGVLGGAGHFLLIKAFERSEASLIAPFAYSSIIWATLLGWAVFNRIPDEWTFAGAALIIASGLYIWHRERLIALRNQASRASENAT